MINGLILIVSKPYAVQVHLVFPLPCLLFLSLFLQCFKSVVDLRKIGEGMESDGKKSCVRLFHFAYTFFSSSLNLTQERNFYIMWKCILS